ncbi:MAG: hypothetical protein ABW252_14870 [Polyangiales bacterium]
MAAGLRRFFSGPRSDLALAVVAMLLTLPAMWLTLDSDDYLQVVSLDASPGIRGLGRAPWDLYAFGRDAASIGALREEGVWPWWADTSAVISFFRPLASLSRWLDHAVWPHSVALMEAHSLAWFGLLLWGTSRLYRRLASLPWVAGVAFALFALDEARAATIAWLCNRNALIALAFGVCALLAHDRARSDGDRRAVWVATACFALALLGGEGALAMFGYLAAYALFIDRGTPFRRATSLLPYLGVIAVWAVVYVSLGYGAVRSGFYIDPVREPLLFLRVLPERLTIYTVAMFEGVSADWYNIAPLFGWNPRPKLLPISAGLVALLCVALLPLVRRDRVARFWALGALISMVPICGTSPSDRMLTAPALGGMSLLAMLLTSLVDGTHPAPRLWVRAYAGLLALVNLVFSPLLLPLFVAMIDDFDAALARADLTVPRAGAQDLTVVLVNPPFDTFAVFFRPYRQIYGHEQPKHFRWLATGVFDLSIERVDAHSLRVAPAPGYWANSSQLMLRSLAHPMAQGTQVALDGVRFEVESLTPDGRPAKVLVRFDEPLDSPSMRLLQWDRYGYVPFRLPAIGETVVLPKVDMEAALKGPEG